MKQSADLLFMSHVQTLESGCWIWTAYKNGAGYGVFRYGRRLWLAHRWAYEFLFGHPAAEELHHTCKNRACVNPEHVQPTTGRSHPDKISVINREKLFCPAGHPYSVRNTYVDPIGGRHCRACGSIVDQKRYLRKRTEIRQQQAEYYAKHRETIQAKRRAKREART